MGQLLIRGLEPEVIERLKARAKRNSRSLEAEVRLILTEAAPDRARIGEFTRFAAEMRKATAGKITDDSADLIRADRDR